jgi:hypothetical protein
MEKRSVDYQEVVELLEWLPGVWQSCEVVRLVGTGLGYVEHKEVGGFVPYHLVSGAGFAIVAETEVAVKKCVEGLAEMAEWRLDIDALFQEYSAQEIDKRVQILLKRLLLQEELVTVFDWQTLRKERW